MTKIVHIQYSTESAGSAALRLQKAFIDAGLQSNIISLQKDNASDLKTKTLGRKHRLIAKIDTRIKKYLTRHSVKEFGLFSYPVLGTDIANLPEVKNADIIYIHWALNGFLNLKGFEQLAKLNKPVIFFMHDMWNISGGCHYSFTCDNYTSGCNNCQMFPQKNGNSLAAKGFKKKQQFYNKYNNLYFVSPSKWLFNCAKESLLTKDKPVFYIPNVIDNTLFKPFDKNIAKGILNIDTQKTVIAFGAVSINSPYKGWSYLQEALDILHKRNEVKNVLILIFGSGYDKNIAASIPFETKFMGYLCDEYSTSLVYNAADVFIAPSLAEAFGYVVFEALNCGTPVVGFNTGGIPDMIKHKENGYLAKYKDAEDIAEGVKYCLQHNVKGTVLPGLEPATVVQKHIALFDLIRNNSKQVV
jgi:glycosyltransferase involved in cell wall biosynthesis